MALAMMYCAKERKRYEAALREHENGYEQKTNIWEALTIAETQGPHMVGETVAAVLAGAACDALEEPVTVLTELFMALRYKVKFFDLALAKNKSNPAVDILSKVYAKCMDVANEALQKDIPQTVRECVEDKIYYCE